MSLGTLNKSSRANLIATVNKEDDVVIVKIYSAGNLGYDSNKASSSRDADKVITVAAMNYRDQITSYNNQGGLSPLGKVKKLDIIVLGVCINGFTMFSVDSNSGDVGRLYASD